MNNMKKLYYFYFNEQWHKLTFLTGLRIFFAIITLPFTILSFFVPVRGVETRFIFGMLSHVFVYIIGTMLMVVIDNELNLHLATSLPPFEKFILIYSMMFLICGIFYYIDKNLIKFFKNE